MTTPAPPPSPPSAPVTVIPALPAAPPEDGWVFLQHFLSPSGDDFYTADGREQDFVAGTLHYGRLGPAGCVYAGPGGAVPLYRFYSPSLHRHYYTADPDAIPGGASGPAPGDWQAEGVAGYLAHGPVTAPCLTAIPTTAYVYVMGDPPAPVTPGAPPPPPDPGAVAAAQAG